MRIVEEKIYTYEELSESAKERARRWWIDGADYPFHDENLQAIREFCDFFNVDLKDWSIGGRGEYLKTTAENHHFRGFTLEHGKKLKEMGYFPKSGTWLDCVMIESFYENFKKTGDALYSFKQALESALVAINRDIEYQFSDESAEEMIICNEYEFTADGKRYH